LQMNTRSSARPSWVWASLALQLVLVLLSAEGFIDALGAWSKYPAQDTRLQLVIFDFIPDTMAAVSLLGLWRAEPWGWWFAVLADGVFCAPALWFLLNYGGFVFRYPRVLVFDVLDVAALTILLYRPVKNHFLGRNGVRRRATTTPGSVQPRRVRRTVKPQRILAYFAGAVTATCVATAFLLAVCMGQKNGGSRGFILFLYYGFIIGSLAAFLFAVALTLLVRKLGSGRLWLWLVAGGVLAPGLSLALGLIGIAFFATGIVGVALRGPVYLLQAWWLTILPGVFTGLICYTMYPWTFEPE
jgi:hypothetical protein